MQSTNTGAEYLIRVHRFATDTQKRYHCFLRIKGLKNH